MAGNAPPTSPGPLPDRVQRLQQRIGYSFTHVSLALEALTHCSHSQPHNERLEFLGDGVLNLVVAQWLFQQQPLQDEGALSRQRSALVNREALLQVAQGLDLLPLLQLGPGERQGGAARSSILAYAVEAIIGAVFCDGGYPAAAQLVQHLLQPLLDRSALEEAPKDAKSRLQEWLQARRLALPQYQLLETRGEAHDQTFVVRCQLAQPIREAQAQGKSRRMAEQRAAQQVMQQLVVDFGD